MVRHKRQRPPDNQGYVGIYTYFHVHVHLRVNDHSSICTCLALGLGTIRTLGLGTTGEDIDIDIGEVHGSLHCALSPETFVHTPSNPARKHSCPFGGHCK
jgi:hypothetical protein